MTAWGKDLICKLKGLSSIPKTHMKSRAWWYMLGIPCQKSGNKRVPGAYWSVYTSHHDPGASNSLCQREKHTHRAPKWAVIEITTEG